MIAVEYIWIGGCGEFRSKIRYVKNESEIVDWNYDGSSTGQATTENSEIVLRPVAKYRDYNTQSVMAMGSNKIYVLCETYSICSDGVSLVPLANNYRFSARELVNDDMWFGFEQEFFIYDLMRGKMLGTHHSMPGQGPYYCGVEAVDGYRYGKESLEHKSVTDVRELTEQIAQRCADLGLGITGWNLEVAPGQTEIQIFGKGLRACDDLMMMRYLAHRVLLEVNMKPVFSPKPLGSKWNGSGLHTNVSTSRTRDEGGLDVIKAMMERLTAAHADHIAEYGEGNEVRLTGLHETSSMNEFSWSVGGRHTSVRIPRLCAMEGKGYFEDRRPAGNADPYRIATRIAKTLTD
jgi:glutamine synthetase